MRNADGRAPDAGAQEAVDREWDRKCWLTDHVDRGHGIKKRENYDECSCGATFWRTEKPADAGPQKCRLCEKPQPCPEHGRTPVTDADWHELHEDVGASWPRRRRAAEYHHLVDQLRALVQQWTDPEFWKDEGGRMDSRDCAKQLAALLPEAPA